MNCDPRRWRGERNVIMYSTSALRDTRSDPARGPTDGGTPAGPWSSGGHAPGDRATAASGEPVS